MQGVCVLAHTHNHIPSPGASAAAFAGFVGWGMEFFNTVFTEAVAAQRFIELTRNMSMLATEE